MSPEMHPNHVIGLGIVYAMHGFDPNKPVPAPGESKPFDDLADLIGGRRLTALGCLQVLAAGKRRIRGAETLTPDDRLSAGQDSASSIAQALRNIYAMTVAESIEQAAVFGRDAVGDLLSVANGENAPRNSMPERRAAVKALTGLLEGVAAPYVVEELVLAQLTNIVESGLTPSLIEAIAPTENQELLAALEHATNQVNEKETRAGAGMALALSGQLSTIEKTLIIRTLNKGLEDPDLGRRGRSFGDEFEWALGNLERRLSHAPEAGVRPDVVSAVVESCYVEIDGYEASRGFRPRATAQVVAITAPNDRVRREWLNRISDLQIPITPMDRVAIREILAPQSPSLGLE